MLSVVLYHAGIGPAAGFVGVDVFFVISGYLITALLYREWSVTGRVDLFAFYARRFRRLFAALVLVVVSTLLISAFVLSPFGEFRQVALSAAASFAFASNFFFEMTTGGYFDGSTDKLPLLHLWSLAVEEQFYLVWPILLIVVLRLRPRSLTPVLVVLTLASLVLSELVDYWQSAGGLLSNAGAFLGIIHWRSDCLAALWSAAGWSYCGILEPCDTDSGRCNTRGTFSGYRSPACCGRGRIAGVYGAWNNTTWNGREMSKVPTHGVLRTDLLFPLSLALATARP